MSRDYNQRPPLRVHPAPITNPAARLWALFTVWWLRLRVSSARDDCADLLATWDWIPKQLEHHRQQMQAWTARADALDNRLLGLRDGPSTLTNPNTQPAPLH
jgi:hypothetical protein